MSSIQLLAKRNNTSYFEANAMTQTMNRVIEGELKQANVYFDLDFTNPKQPSFQVKEIDTKGPTEKKISDIFLKIAPLSSEVQGCKISFCDNNTKCLEPFGFQFAEQDVYKVDGKTFSILQRLVAPSIGGKKALALIKDTTQTLGIPILYVSDGSLLSTNKCCKESSLISLKLLQIFKYGETWYEGQGAQSTSSFEGINYQTFQYLNEYLEKFVNLKLYNQSYIEDHYLKLLKLTQDEINDAFSKSKQYLYQLTIEQLLSIFKGYEPDSALHEIYQSTFDAARITETPHSARIGELAQNISKLSCDVEDLDLHKLKHTFFESVISFNYKHLLEFYLEKLQNPQKIEELFLSLLLSLVYVEQFLSYLFDITQPYYKEVSASRDIVVDFVSHCLTNNCKGLKSYLENHLKLDAPFLSEKAVKT